MGFGETGDRSHIKKTLFQILIDNLTSQILDLFFNSHEFKSF
jgi:hypothetical protein